MLFDREGIKIFVYREPIDMRAGFERLHGYCVHHLEAKINDGHAYVFFGKNRKRMKILMYDGSGLVLIAKRIERNKFMSHEELLGRTELALSELRLLFHGGVVREPLFGEKADRLDREALERLVARHLCDTEKTSTTQWEGVALPLGNQNARLPSCPMRESSALEN
jgi:transposase